MNLRSKQLGNAGMFASLMNSIGAKKPAADQQKQGQLQNKGTTQESSAANPDLQGKDPNDPNNLDTNKSQNKPLDIFKDLFQTPTVDSADATPSFSLNQEALTKITEKLDFAGQLSPELLDKLKSGDSETVHSVLNTVGRNGYMMLMRHIPALTEKYVNARLEHSQKGLGKSVKNTLTQQSLAKKAADNPVLKEQLDAISSRLLERYPDADPDWLAEQSADYFVQVARLLSPDSFVQEGEAGTGEETGPRKRRDPRDIAQNPDFPGWATYLTGNAIPAATKK